MALVSNANSLGLGGVRILELWALSDHPVSKARRGCLMQDRLYRTDVAMQTKGYFYAPQLGRTLLPGRQ